MYWTDSVLYYRNGLSIYTTHNHFFLIVQKKYFQYTVLPTCMLYMYQLLYYYVLEECL